MLWVRDEISYDRFHENTDRLYRLVVQADLGEQSFKAVVTPGEFFALSAKQYPRGRSSLPLSPIDFRHPD